MKMKLSDLTVTSFTTGMKTIVGGESQECTNDTWTRLYHMCPGPSGLVYCTWEPACTQ